MKADLSQSAAIAWHTEPYAVGVDAINIGLPRILHLEINGAKNSALSCMFCHKDVDCHTHKKSCFLAGNICLYQEVHVVPGTSKNSNYVKTIKVSRVLSLKT